MRVLLFTPSYPPRVGGLETATQRLAHELRQQGHAVTVASNRYPRTLPHITGDEGILVYRTLYPALFLSRNRPKGRQLLKALALMPLIPVALIRLLVLTRRLNPDVVNVHYFSDPAMYMIIVAWLLRIPIVLSFHGSDLPTVPFPANRVRPTIWACHRARSVTVCSNDMRRHLVSLLGENTTAVVAKNGVDPHKEEPERLGGELTRLLVVSRLTEKKGIDVALRAFAVVISRHPEARLIVAGDGPLREHLESIADAEGIGSSVDFLGTVDQRTVRALIGCASIVLVPSLWEAFGIVALEAMAGGRPVIASDTGGLRDIVIPGETGLLVPSGDLAALADAISVLLDEPDRATQMGRQGRTRAAREFNWSRTADAYLGAYERAVASVTQPSPIPGRQVAP